MGRDFLRVGAVFQVIQCYRALALAQRRRTLGQVVVHLAVAVGQVVQQRGGLGEVLHHLVFIDLLVLQHLVELALHFPIFLVRGGRLAADAPADKQSERDQRHAPQDEDFNR